ncbi:mannosyltransferase putative-domain-containing protein [Aspergillus pseudoustus]|uniref:Mannosyltransferase putative-domain-containing protein n=1 Tax=Aspergillus pseudoustus TaxID=1810923 RepID=A0ABR4IQ29_9EURO
MLFARRTILIYSVIAFFLLNLYYLWSRNTRQIPFSPARQSQLWQRLQPLLEEYAPNCPPPELNGSPGTPRFDAVNESPRSNHISNVDEIELPMQAKHDGFVQAIRNAKLGSAYTPGTTGIVSSAGGTYLPTFLATVRLLRRTGSTLPVELFMKDGSEYESTICEDILPPLGVKCVILSDIFAGEQQERSPNMESSSMPPIEGFQIKAFAIVFSSFENLLWLDADCAPLHDPATILTSDPFTSTGMVTWPDFWANTAAPVYFSISRQPAPLSTTRQASEAGILAISKSSHFLTLALAAYYNYYGPDYYYTLLDQGAPGAGDKDTFLQAATALDEPFYAVSERTADVGNITPWNSEVAINAGYLQADPIEDFALTSSGIWRVKGEHPSSSPPSSSSGDTYPLQPSSTPPRAFFIHAGDPEFNPGNELLGEKLIGFDKKPTRMWSHPPEAMERIGFDAERVFWEETLYIACELQPGFETWKGREQRLCERVKAHWGAVFVKEEEEERDVVTGSEVAEDDYGDVWT